MNDEVRAERERLIAAFVARYSVIERAVVDTPDHERLEAIRLQVLALLAEGDEIAARIRKAAVTY